MLIKVMLGSDSDDCYFHSFLYKRCLTFYLLDNAISKAIALFIFFIVINSHEWKHYVCFVFLAIKVQRKSESDDSVEFVSSYIQGGNDSVIYQGTVKKEMSPSNSYMADESSMDSSAQMDVDYSKQLYELYNSRRTSIAADSGPFIHADEQMNGLYLSWDIKL